MYYLRSKPATNAIKFTVDVESLLNETSDKSGIDMNLFNTNMTVGNIEQRKPEEPTDSNLVKRDPGLDPEKVVSVVCPLRRRKKGDPAPTKQELEDCQMCGS